MFVVVIPYKPEVVQPPMKIAMMLHFATVVGPFAPEAQRKSRSYVRFVKGMLREKLIERPSDEERRAYPGWAYRATDRGRAYVKALTEVPLPRSVTTWQ